jgi:type IV secretion system protein VirD4|tara:strand:- start:6927 stop:8393 length:1467 start_codon:yes stop_codon:yes gene_type:complete
VPEFTDLPRGLPNHRPEDGKAAQGLWMHPDKPYESGKWAHDPSKLFLGADLRGRRLGLADDRHLLTVAGSRAGKGTSAIIPNLLMYEGSMIVIDPKGENANETAERRGKGNGIKAGGLGHDVFVIDPFHTAHKVADEYRAGFNPLAGLDPKSKSFIDDCNGIAESLVVKPKDDKNPFFNDTAQFVIRGLIAWVAMSPDHEKRNLPEVYRIISMPESEFEKVLEAMSKAVGEGWGLPTNVAFAIQTMIGSDEWGKILSSVRQHLMFMDSPEMADALRNNDRNPDMYAWKMGGQSIYLCLPAGLLHTHNRFFRLFLNQLLSAVEKNKGEPKIRAVMMLDEMHVLGHMQILQTSAALIAGYHVLIWSFWQDFSQLESIYGKGWETFIGNASVFQSFGVNDLKTLKYISDRLGVSSVLSLSNAEINKTQAATNFTGQSKSIQQSPLLTHDEVAYHFSRQSNSQLIIYPGTSPIWIKRLPYYEKFFDDMRPSQ